MRINNILTEKIHSNRMTITYIIDYNAEGLPVKKSGKKMRKATIGITIIIMIT